MQYQQDWIKRQIEIIVSVLRGIIKGREANKNHFDQFEQSRSLSDSLSAGLLELLDENKICEAENMLFEAIDNKEATLETALWFYSKINHYTEQRLEAANFSRTEIASGLQAACKRYGISEEGVFAVLEKLQSNVDEQNAEK